MAQPPPQPPRVALLIESSRGSGRSILRGIAEYLRSHDPWVIFQFDHRVGDRAPKPLRDGHIDGVIARVENPRLAKDLAALDVPTIDVLGYGRMADVPSFGTDQEAAARMAFVHLRERGLEHFAYCGYPGLPSSDRRSDGLAACAEAEGSSMSVFRDTMQKPPAPIEPAPIKPAPIQPAPIQPALIEPTEARGYRRENALARWVDALPKPVGLMAFNDICAQQLLNVCIQQSVSVPNDVAVVGVDNDEVVCELCNPTLSSIQVNNRRVGREAAAMLDRMLAGRRVKPAHVSIPPTRVVARRSTDTMAMADADVAEALRWIRDEACAGITAEDVVRRVALSYATLRRRFDALLGHSLKEEIDRVRIRHVQRWLAETSLPLAEIAPRTGYDHVESLCRVFKRRTGQTPGQYRKDCQT